MMPQNYLQRVLNRFIDACFNNPTTFTMIFGCFGSGLVLGLSAFILQNFEMFVMACFIVVIGLIFCLLPLGELLSIMLEEWY